MLFDKVFTMIKINFSLSPRGPILIKSGTDSFLEPALSDMTFVRAMTPWGESMYIPGSSLKGVIRSYSESYLRARNKRVCDLFSKGESCGDKLREEKDGEKRYKGSCMACRTFGSTVLASKVSISDLFPFKQNDSEEEKRKKIEELSKYTFVKYGVAISREKGSVAVGPFDMEVLYGGTFYGSITLTNPELWQVGLLLFAIRDINAGFVQIGFAKSRGLGRVSIDIKDIEVASIGDKIIFARGLDQETYDDVGEFEKEGRGELLNIWRFKKEKILESTFFEKTKEAINEAS